MLRQELTYEDFDGETVTETFYFNLTKTELLELEVEHKEGMHDFLQQIVKTEDRKSLIEQWQKIILLAYGEKSPDGKSFMKGEEIRNAFKHTAAYDTLFMKLSEDADFAATWTLGVLPKDLASKVEKATAEEKKNETKTETPEIKPEETPNP